MSAPRSPDVGLLFREYGPLVLRRAGRVLGTPADAEEVLQEVFIRAMSHLDELGRMNERQTIAWLYQATTNLCLNRLRDHRRRRELTGARLAPSPEDEAEPARAENLAQARRLLARLDEKLALVAVYVFVDAMSYSEVAELLGCSKRTVGNLVERVLKAANDAGEPLEAELAGFAGAAGRTSS